MSVTQQQVADVLVTAFQAASGISTYDTLAPDDKATPYCVITFQTDIPENTFGRENTAHTITFLVKFTKLKSPGPAALRTLADTVFTALNRTRLDIADDQNEVECIDRGGPALDDTNMLELVMTWTYKGSF
jgi:hypothetical protein